MRRDWGAAWEKCHYEGACRACGSTKIVDPAHIVPRSRGGDMDPLNIVPLCRFHHTEYDSSRLELLPLLTRLEQQHIVGLVGICEAYIRTTVRQLP